MACSGIAGRKCRSGPRWYGKFLSRNDGADSRSSEVGWHHGENQFRPIGADLDRSSCHPSQSCRNSADGICRRIRCFKISRIRTALRQRHADGMLISALDDIAWTLNLRGTDVHCVPVFVSYLLISSQQVSLYVDSAKINDEVKAYLTENGISLYPYNKVAEGLERYSSIISYGWR